MPDAARILAFDHFSDQDISALIETGGDRFAWRTVPYWRFRNVANRLLPPEVRHGLEPWTRPGLELQKTGFSKRTRREVARLYLEWPFDAFLLPSDTYYYVRFLPAACHELGIPVIVAQKETTITDSAMERHAPDVGRHAPFISDRMTVCSERHKQFWIEAGADGSLIDVTGQPRFDIYAGAREEVVAGSQPTVLFLSYEPDAYLLEDDAEGRGWRDLKQETERVLFEASEHGWHVVVKLHPLQDRDAEASALARAAPGNVHVELAEPGADTRRLILSADAVVGFQTTALYEAMAAGRPIAYAGWGALHERLAPGLIPFDQRPDLLDVVRGPDELTAWLRDPPKLGPGVAARRAEFVQEMLGPIDGQAAERTLTVLLGEITEWSESRGSSRRRKRLDVLAGPARIALGLKAGGALLLLGSLRQIAHLLPSKAQTRVERAVAFHAGSHRELLSALRQKTVSRAS